jgi:tripartite-type tricarboxylate transporter receptor subunit TctC
METKMNIKKIGVLLGLSMTLTCAAWAQAPYRASRVSLVTHSSPGGGTDLFLCELSKHLPAALNANFAVENVRGGSEAKAVAHPTQHHWSELLWKDFHVQLA